MVKAVSLKVELKSQALQPRTRRRLRRDSDALGGLNPIKPWTLRRCMMAEGERRCASSAGSLPSQGVGARAMESL